MSKKKIWLLVLCICMAGCLVCGCSQADSDNTENDNQTNNKSKTELFDNSDELKNVKRLNGLGAIYDGENIYFDGQDGAYYKLDKDGMLTVNCKDASCTHDKKSCKAYIENGEYFVFNGKLYKYYNEGKYGTGVMVSEGYIMDVSTGDIVFDNPVPDDLGEELAMDDSTEIFYVRVLNDDYMKVEGHQHVYILDKNFDIKYWYSDVGKFPWGMIHENDYYYVNDLHQMIKVDLNTNTREALELDSKIFAGDNDEEYIFYSNEYEELFKYSLAEGISTKIAEDALMFSVQDHYIYCANNIQKKILDKAGNFIADYTDYENMGGDNILQIKGKMYTCFENGVAEMDEDGGNYKEYSLE